MKKHLFQAIFALISLSAPLFSCSESPLAEDKAGQTAEQFARHYFTWRLGDAMPLADEDMERQIIFLSSNVHKADMEALHSATEVPVIELEDVTMKGDSNAIATFSLRNVYLMDTLGTRVHLYNDIKKELTLKLTDTGWKVSGIGDKAEER